MHSIAQVTFSFKMTDIQKHAVASDDGTTSSSYLLDHLENLLLVAVHVCVCADLCHVDAFPVSKSDNLVKRENQIKCLRGISASFHLRYQGGHWLLLTKQRLSQ
jgi:hypothetical protein